MNTVNLEVLRQGIDTNPKYKALLGIMSKRERGRADSTVARQRRVSKEGGVDLTKKEMIDFFSLMQKGGAGRWVSGRNGNAGRFVWGWNMQSVAEQVLDPKGTADKLKPAPKKRSVLPKVGPDGKEAPKAAPAPKAEPIVTRSAGGKSIRIKAAGFDIELPMGMNAQEQREAATFLAAVNKELRVS